VTDRSQWATAAVAYVGERSGGGPADRRLRVTLNFHPDRRADGMSVVEQLARDLTYRSLPRSYWSLEMTTGVITTPPSTQRDRSSTRPYGGTTAEIAAPTYDAP